MALKRIRKRLGRASSPMEDAPDPQFPTDDPQVMLMLAQAEAASVDRDEDPVRYARARTAMAGALYEMRRRGWGDTDRQAVTLLDEAIDILELSRPASRADLVEARYLAADIRRGRDWQAAREHYEAGLQVARRDSEPTLWAALNEGLAAALVRGPQGDEPEIQERSLNLYQEALTIEPPAIPRGHWAATAHGFALTLVERHRGSVVQNWTAVLDIMGRAFEPSSECGDGIVRDGVFELYGRALVATGVHGVIQGGVPDDVVLGNVRLGAQGLDTLRPPEDALTPRADELAALVRKSGAGHEAMCSALDIGIGLLEAIEDRRGLVLLHAKRSRWPDAPGGQDHLAEAERLLSLKDDESLQEVVERARTIRSRGQAELAAKRPAARGQDTHEPLPYEDDELSHVAVFFEVHDLLAGEAVAGVAIEQALDAARAGLAAVHTPAARTAGLMAVGLLWMDRPIGDRRGNLEEARTCFETALELGVAAGSERAMLLHNLGLVYKRRSAGVRAENLETAISHLESALECHSRDGERAEWATTASQLANTYTERVLGDQADNIERALELYDQALERRPRAEVPVRWAITKHNLGTTLQERRLGNRRRNLEAALEHLHEALEVRTEEALPEHFAMTQDVIADCHVALAKSDVRRALEHLAAATAALEASGRVWTLDRNRQQWLNNRLRLVDVQIARGEAGGGGDAQAIDIAERVLETASVESEPQRVAIAQDRLATLLARSGRSGDRERAIEARRNLLEQLTGAGDLAGVSREAAALGRLLADEERWSEAAEVFRRALEAEADVSLAAISLTTRWARMRSVGGLHTDAAFAFGHPSLGQWPEALATLERGRTRVLGDTFERDHRRLDALERLGPEAAEARAEFLDAARTMSALATAEVRSGGLAGHAPTAAARDDARRARDRLLTAKAAIQEFPGFGTFLEPPGIDGVYRAAWFGGPLVHLWATEHGGLAVATVYDGSGTARCIATPLLLRSTDVDDVLFPSKDDAWPGLLEAQRTDDAQVLDLALDEVLPWVGKTISAPLLQLLTHVGADRALLVPCGRLGALPVLAAPCAALDPGCLLDSFSIELTPSASVAVAAHDAAPAAGGRRYAAIADSLPEAAPLPWAVPEVLAVANAAGAGEPLIGSAATRSRAIEAMRGASVVHLACHGVYDPSAPERSHMVLADGGLAVTDMLSGRLLDGVRLVVASACETGASDLTRIPDEATGLPAALLQAGARHVLGTLWRVDDLSSSLLASRVAEACLDPTADPPTELAAAQRWLRDVGREEALAAGRRLVSHAGARATPELEDDLTWLQLAAPERPFRAPRHWAPFVMFGPGAAGVPTAAPAHPRPWR